MSHFDAKIGSLSAHSYWSNAVAVIFEAQHVADFWRISDYFSGNRTTPRKLRKPA